MSEDELRAQVELLTTALDECPRSRFSCALPRDEPERSTGDAIRRAHYLDHVRWIAAELVARAEMHGRALIWPRLRAWQASETNPASAHDLYDGSLGPALFLAAVAAVTKLPSWAEAARAAASPACSWLRKTRLVRNDGFVGIGHGLGSMVYSLVWIGRLLGDGRYIGFARDAAALIPPERIEHDVALDVTCGAAGMLLALHALREEAEDRAISRLVDCCVERLLTARIPRQRGVAWRALDGRFHTGFAHGASGIGHALFRHFVRTGREDCRTAAVAAFQFERALHSPSAGEWPTVEPSGSATAGIATFMTAWCHGAPGIALARGSACGLTDSAEIESDSATATAATLRKRAASFESLCCGNLGRAEILLTLGHAGGDAELIGAAHNLGQAAIARARARGHFTLSASGHVYRVFDPGFFQGLSGVGYVLMRLAAPDELPSVLAFQSPLDRRVAPRMEVLHGHR